MLTNKDLNALKEFCEKSHLPILKELAIEAFDELLTLREAVAPQMAEVDALETELDDSITKTPTLSKRHAFHIAKDAIWQLRTAIFACEKEKQRADRIAGCRDHRE